MKKERINEIWGVFFLLLGLFTLASLVFFDPSDIPFFTSHPTSPVHNYTGIIGAYLSFGLLLTFGISAYVIPIIFLLWAGCYFLQEVPEKKMFKFMGLVVALLSTATLVTLSVSVDDQLAKGGVVGYLVGNRLLQYLGMVGSFILATSCLLLSLLLATEFLIYPIVKNFFSSSQESFENFIEMTEEFRESLGEKIASLWRRDEEDEGEEVKSKKTPQISLIRSFFMYCGGRE